MLSKWGDVFHKKDLLMVKYILTTSENKIIDNILDNNHTQVLIWDAFHCASLSYFMKSNLEHMHVHLFTF